ncbi:MAG: hypothetical protein ACTSRB_18115 [Candidatus Helarchaeota archaeon]
MSNYNEFPRLEVIDRPRYDACLRFKVSICDFHGIVIMNDYLFLNFSTISGICHLLNHDFK